MQTTRYKGFEILSRPQQLPASGLWTFDIVIRREGQVLSFSVAGRFATEPAADAECRDLGERIIDGRVPGWSTAEMRPSGPGRSALAYMFDGRAAAMFLVAVVIIIGLGGFAVFR